MSNTPITGIVNALTGGGFYLRISDRTLIPRSTAIRLVNAGMNDGRLDGMPPPHV